MTLTPEIDNLGQNMVKVQKVLQIFLYSLVFTYTPA